MLQVLVLTALAALASATRNAEVHNKYLTLPKAEFVEYFNSQNFTWKIRHHDHLEGMQFGIKEDNLTHVKRIKHDRTTYHFLPEEFDSRDAWPYCASISEIYNQGKCGSCWAFGTATVLSDRTCIHTGEEVALSETDYVCLEQDICAGGRVLDAFEFWVQKGFVTLDCLPYDALALRDKKITCDHKCQDKSIDYDDDKHYGDSIYTMDPDDYNIRSDIVENGPIQASFDVFEDFVDYKSGVYMHTYGRKKGRHSVRVLGFGEEDGIPYWLVANSWDTVWGDNGYVKIERFQKLLGFEEQLLAGLPYY